MCKLFYMKLSVSVTFFLITMTPTKWTKEASRTWHTINRVKMIISDDLLFLAYIAMLARASNEEPPFNPMHSPFNVQ